MKKMIILTAIVLSGCTRDGGAYVCTGDEGVFDAQARIGLFSGEVREFRAVDGNGIKFTINEANSRSFECEGKREYEERQARLDAENKARCAREKNSGNLWAMGPCA